MQKIPTQVRTIISSTIFGIFVCGLIYVLFLPWTHISITESGFSNTDVRVNDEFWLKNNNKKDPIVLCVLTKTDTCQTAPGWISNVDGNDGLSGGSALPPSYTLKVGKEIGISFTECIDHKVVDRTIAILKNGKITHKLSVLLMCYDQSSEP